MRPVLVASFLPSMLAFVAMAAMAFGGNAARVPALLVGCVELALVPGLYPYQHVRAAKGLGG